MTGFATFKIAMLATLLVMCYLASLGQILHAFALSTRKRAGYHLVLVFYEALIAVSLLFSTSFAMSVYGNASTHHLVLFFILLPLEKLFWINGAVFLVGLILFFARRKFYLFVDLVFFALMTPPSLWLFGSAWSVVFIVCMVFFFFRVLAHLILDVRNQRNAVTDRTVAEAVKNLPEGILFVNERGHVVIMNDVMRSCLLSLGFSTDLSDMRGLWNALRNKVACKDCSDTPVDEEVKLKIADNETRLFVADEVIFNKRPCQRILALDVTTEENLNMQIEETNLLLEKATVELSNSMKNLQQTVEEQALLSMHSRVHDAIGQRLSILHRYIEDKAMSQEALEQIELLFGRVVEDLATNDTSDPEINLKSITEAFSLVNLMITTEGDLPQDGVTASLFVDIIREATTNAAKHAQASRVWVIFSTDENGHHLTLRNDGLSCHGVFQEGFGLSGMRTSVETLDGIMSIYAQKEFTIEVTIPTAKALPYMEGWT